MYTIGILWEIAALGVLVWGVAVIAGEMEARRWFSWPKREVERYEELRRRREEKKLQRWREAVAAWKSPRVSPPLPVRDSGRDVFGRKPRQ